MSTGKKTPLRSRAKVTLEASFAASMVLGKLSCPTSGPSSAHGDAAPTVTVTATPPESPESGVLADLRRAAVLSSAPARRTLFTWTTREQIEQLVRDRTLLTRTESPVHGPALYDQVVATRAAAGDVLAAKLRTPGFVRARHAWANPWATFLGWQDETYGDELVMVNLKHQAWTAVLTTSKPGWEVFDVYNGRVDVAEAILHPERIGAVYFVQDTPGAGADHAGHDGGGPGERDAFREYVLCNESMIETWSVGEPLMAAILSVQTELIERLTSALPPGETAATSLDEWNAAVARSVWPGPEVPLTLAGAYEAALPFPNAAYVLTPGRMSALTLRLRGVTVHEPALTHTPQVPPPVVSASVGPLPPPVPRKVPPRPGTWARRRGTH